MLKEYVLSNGVPGVNQQALPIIEVEDLKSWKCRQDTERQLDRYNQECGPITVIAGGA